MNFLGVIPARAGSKRLPGKNLKTLGGVPLIGHTIRAAQQSKRLTDFVVSTESQEVADVAHSMGAPVFHRSPHLSKDDVTSGAVLASVLEDYRQFGIDFDLQATETPIDAVVCLHPTSPFRDGIHIDLACDKFEHDNRPYLASMMRLTEKSHYNYLTCWGQYWREMGYVMNGAIYIIDAQTLLKERSHVPVKNGRIPVKERLIHFPMKKEHSLDIDDKTDWAYAEGLINAQKS